MVNPLQGKHLCVSPSRATELFRTLGGKVREKYGDAKLVIGFAETATAAGMGVAKVLGGDCTYIHTTRENVTGENRWLEFSEEHSHAVEQKLAASRMEEYLGRTKIVVFVDDEISTGKTMINIAEQLKKTFPSIKEKKLVVASIMSRVTGKDLEKLEECGFECVSLFRPAEADYPGLVQKYGIYEASEPEEQGRNRAVHIETCNAGVVPEDPRLGVNASEYSDMCRKMAERLIKDHELDRRPGRVLVLGTEEYMYPAMVLGTELEKITGFCVFTHSTTRSPIGICDDPAFPEYPVKSGFKLKSLYEPDRTTYIYNLGKYDKVIVLTDSRQDLATAADSLVRALVQTGNDDILLVRG